MARILGIDFGLRRCGVAVSDASCMVALPLRTVDTAELMVFLRSYSASHPIQAIVFGQPLSLDGSPNCATDAVARFLHKLQTTLPAVTLYYEDERFTSQIALQTQIECGHGRKKRGSKGGRDLISSILILQSFLNRYNNGWALPIANKPSLSG